MDREFDELTENERKVLTVIFQNVRASAKELMKLLNFSRAGIDRLLIGLCASGYLRREKVGRTYYYYADRGLVQYQKIIRYLVKQREMNLLRPEYLFRTDKKVLSAFRNQANSLERLVQRSKLPPEVVLKSLKRLMKKKLLTHVNNKYQLIREIDLTHAI